MKFEDITTHKGDHFKVLGGTDLSQVAVMTIPPGGNSGYENSHEGDQVVYVLSGHADIEVAKRHVNASSGDVVIIPKGAEHLIQNTGGIPLFFLNVYTLPQY